MDKVLGQVEIDALFANVNGSEAQLRSETPEIERYNFARTGQIAPQQIAAVKTVSDAFARSVANTFGAWLRSAFQVALVSCEQILFAEFVERVVERTYICATRVAPLGAVGLLEVELAVAAPVVDLLLGGTGRVAALRPLTEIEESIMTSVVTMLLQQLTTAWRSVHLEFHLDGRQAATEIARLIPAGERTLCVCFEVRMPESSGLISLCLPAVVLNALREQLVEERERHSPHTSEVASRIRTMLAQVPVKAVMDFPRVRLRTREVMELRPGSVLKLPIPRFLDAQLHVDGMILGPARPVRMGEHRGAKLRGLCTGSIGNVMGRGDDDEKGTGKE